MNVRRAQSRSPFSSKSSYGGSPVPAFQPPSFYAAAAGIPYLPRSVNPASEDKRDWNSPSLSRSPEATTPTSVLASYTMHAPMQSVGPDHEPSNSQLSRNGSTSSSRKSISLTRSISRALPRYNKGDKEKQPSGKRKSQLVDIPFLETQLIPSLRDTIDRMTQPPRAKPSDNDDDCSSPGPGGYRTPMPTSPNPQTRWMANSIPFDSPDTRSVQYSFPRSPYVSAEPFTSSSQTSNIPTSTRIPRSPAPKPSPTVPESPRKPLKSALRTPTASSILTRTNSQEADSVAPLPSHPKSLRSVRSMLGGFSSRPDKSPVVKPPPSQIQPSSSGGVRGGSHTKQGTKSKPKPRSNPETPRFTSSADLPTVPSAPNHGASVRSGIPRPGFISGQASDSGTELERRYERTITGGRLVVTNTTVVPSSSESEGEEVQRERWRNRSSTWASQIRQRVEQERMSDRHAALQRETTNATMSRRDPANLHGDRHVRSGVGLGLGLTPRQEEADHVNDEMEEDESVYDDDEAIQGFGHDGRQEYHRPDFNRPNSPASRQGDICQDDRSRSPDTGKRQREALLGIVNGLQQDFRLSSSPRGRGRLSNSESDGTYVSQGIAIGTSGELCFSSNGSRASFGRDSGTEEIAQGNSGRWSIKVQERLENTTYRSNTPGVVEDRRRSVREEIATSLEGSNSREINSRTESSRNSKCRSSSVPAPIRSSRVYPSEEMPAVVGGPRGKGALPESHHPLDSIAPARQSYSQHNADSRPPTHDRNRHPQNESTSVRERERFGIPPSLSYGTREEQEDEQALSFGSTARRKSKIRTDEQLPTGLPHLDSETSSVGGNWRGSGEGGHWTLGAEALFKQISTNPVEDGERTRFGRRQSSHRDHSSEARAWERERQGHDLARHPLSHTRPPSLMSTSSSAPSVYDAQPTEQHFDESSPDLGIETSVGQDSWRSTMLPSTYNVFLAEYGAEELRRQELINQLSCSEEDFVVRLRTVIDLLVLPLRQKDSRRWLPGVPSRISRLFDWLDDIMSLHSSIAGALRSSRRVWQTGGVVLRLADALRAFIPRLEIYQPYLARVNEVKELVDGCVNDPNDEFGEYVRLREHDLGIEDWSLLRFLDEPVQRVSSYPSIFLAMWNETPRDHPDHLPLLSLCYSTTMVLQVLREVRSREEEYEFVKEIASKIECLPPTHQLARRERRLLWHGPVSVTIHSRSKTDHHSGDNRATSIPINRQAESSKPKEPSWQRSSRLIDAIGGLGSKRYQTGAFSSSSSIPSARSFETVSSMSMTAATGASRRLGAQTPRIVVERCSSENLADHVVEGNGYPPTTRSTAQVLVFTDVIVLSSIQKDSRGPHRHAEAKWKLLEGCGIARLFGITDNAEGSITLDLLPLSSSQLQTGVIDEEARLDSVTISLSPNTLPTERATLLAALQESHKHTILSLSFPSFSNTYLTHGPSVDLELDTQRSLKAIMDTGLPLPKSPSVQEWERMSKVIRSEASGGDGHADEDPVEGERQERGWWTLRFQQVLREMQRKEPRVTMDLDLNLTPRAGVRI